MFRNNDQTCKNYTNPIMNVFHIYKLRVYMMDFTLCTWKQKLKFQIEE